MSQWEALQKLNHEFQYQVFQFYEKRFSSETRRSLSVWIESQDWDSAAGDEDKARTCFNALLVYLDEQWMRSLQENTILQGPNFSQMKHNLTGDFQNEPLKLAALLSECLKEEKKILASASMDQLDNKVNELKQLTSEVEEEELQDIQKMRQSEVEQCDGLARSRAVVEQDFLTQANQILLDKVRRILVQTQQTVATLIDVELSAWKSRQQMACIGSPVDTSLDHLQRWFTSVAEVLMRVRKRLQNLQDQSKKCSSASPLLAILAKTDQFALDLLTKLLSKALVVEKQPAMYKLTCRPLILKTKVKFRVMLRSLVNIPELKCLVRPVFDKDAEEVKTAHGFRQFEFASVFSKVLVDSQEGGLVADFEELLIKEKKGKEGTENKSQRSASNLVGVTEELHIIKFVMTVWLPGHTCDLEASTLPLVVISSTGQTSSAWATIMWWAMSSSQEPMNLSLFAEPPPLSWELLSRALNWQFLSVGQRQLHEEQLCLLREKLVDADGRVHWNTFSKNENAWIWIDGVLDLIKKHLVELWRDGHIMGFVSRERTRHLLLNKPAGTFLLRFSESNKEGAISFSWVERSSGKPRVHAVDPYTKKELASLSLPDIIYHYNLTAQRESRNPLQILYPDTDKDTVFGRYYTSSEDSAPINLNGYVNRKMISVSVNPSPPPSPSTEICIMDTDIDIDMDTSTTNDQGPDLLSALLDYPGPSDWMCDQGSHVFHPLSPPEHFAALPLSF